MSEGRPLVESLIQLDRAAVAARYGVGRQVPEKVVSVGLTDQG